VNHTTDYETIPTTVRVWFAPDDLTLADKCIREEGTEESTFNIVSQVWSGQAVIEWPDGSIEIVDKADFEARFRLPVNDMVKELKKLGSQTGGSSLPPGGQSVYYPPQSSVPWSTPVVPWGPAQWIN
jgi:hypothetical protein